MAVLMKYIYQNRKFKFLFFSYFVFFFIHLSFLERCQWSYQYLVCKNVSSLAQFSFFGKNLSAYSYLWTGSSSCNFRCDFTRMTDSTCIASVPRYFTQFLTRVNRWLSIYTHNQLFSFQFRIPERELKRSLSKCYERLFFHGTDICGIPRSFCSVVYRLNRS